MPTKPFRSQIVLEKLYQTYLEIAILSFRHNDSDSEFAFVMTMHNNFSRFFRGSWNYLTLDRTLSSGRPQMQKRLTAEKTNKPSSVPDTAMISG